MLEIISLVLMEMSFICKEFLLLLSRSPPGMRRLSFIIFFIDLIDENLLTSPHKCL